MRYRIRVNDYDYALTNEQVEKIYALLENSVLLYEENVGENVGYVGWKKSYIYNFDKTVHDIDFVPKGMLSDHQLATYKDLWQLRKGEQHD